MLLTPYYGISPVIRGFGENTPYWLHNTGTFLQTFILQGKSRNTKSVTSLPYGFIQAWNTWNCLSITLKLSYFLFIWKSFPKSSHKACWNGILWQIMRYFHHYFIICQIQPQHLLIGSWNSLFSTWSSHATFQNSSKKNNGSCSWICNHN